MDGKVTTLLQILSSLQDAFPPDPVGAASAAEPHAETNEGNAQTQCSAKIDVEKAKHEDSGVEKATGQHALQDTSPVADRDGSNVDAGMQVESQGTLVEEEPWYEVVLATWPGYLPSV
jgi:hypothetical protein